MSQSSQKLQEFFKVLSNENKMQIVQYLMNGEECVCNLAQKVGMEQSLVSHHLQSLRKAGLIVDRRLGNWIHVSLNAAFFEEMLTSYQLLLDPKRISDKKCTNENCCLPVGR